MTRSYTFERTGNTDIGYQAYSGDQRNIRSVYFFVSCRSRTEVQAIVVWHIIDELIISGAVCDFLFVSFSATVSKCLFNVSGSIETFFWSQDTVYSVPHFFWSVGG